MLPLRRQGTEWEFQELFGGRNILLENVVRIFNLFVLVLDPVQKGEDGAGLFFSGFYKNLTDGKWRILNPLPDSFLEFNLNNLKC
jgi:hypothetical protein